MSYDKLWAIANVLSGSDLRKCLAHLLPHSECIGSLSIQKETEYALCGVVSVEASKSKKHICSNLFKLIYWKQKQ